MKKVFSFSTIALAGMLLFFTSCSKDKDEVEKKAPVVPPVTTFAPDFDQMGTPSDTVGSRATAFFDNWGFAYVIVAGWHTLINLSMVVPVAAFKESFNHEAIYDPSSGKWNWSYNVTANNATYLAHLSGKQVNDSVEWEMRITESGAYNNFLWFSGVSATDQSGGYWLLYENPTSPNVLLQIDWYRTSNEVAGITYTNIKPGDVKQGAYVSYKTNTEALNRHFEAYNHEASNTTYVQWHSANMNGRVKDKAHFGDNNWHCWDTNLINTICN